MASIAHGAGLRYDSGMTVTKDLRFAMDEKGLKGLAPTLTGQRISYWDNDRELKHGIVRAAEVARDRYGNPFIEVTLDEETGAGSDEGAAIEPVRAGETPVPVAGGEEGAAAEAAPKQPV